VDTLFLSLVETPVRFDVEALRSVVAALSLEADDWLPPLMDLFEVPVLAEGVRDCVVAGRFCVEAELFWVVVGRLIPPPPPLLPPDMRCASIVNGNSIIAATRNNPEMIFFDAILAFIYRKF
jgi:hypothetical protein